MSTVIDSRAVEMNFDERQFQRGVNSSIDSISNLKKSLNFSESIRAVGELGSAVQKFSVDGMARGVDFIANRFSMLGIMGMTVIANLTNSVVNFAKTAVSSIVVAPLKAGFQEYETQMNAIQTILANTSTKGTTLENVKNALNELNLYSDKTIYNFTEMAKNIGTFTAAGISLDVSVSAIKGIANLAAVSGSNSQQASTAMYQLSQALASGTVKLMDWNSVVNAGMGGQVFQDALKETARAHGVSIDEMIKKEGSFRETLQNGWLTSGILTETLSKFTGDLTAEQLKTMGYTDEQIAGIIKLGITANDAATKVKTITQLQQTLTEAIQSGWGQSFQIIFGDFEEAKILFTSLSDLFGGMIAESSDSRNAILRGWDALGGRTQLVNALRNSIIGINNILKTVGNAISQIFPPVTSLNLLAITSAIERLSEKFKMTADDSSNLWRTFRGLAAGFDIIRMAVSSVISWLGNLIGAILPTGSSILDLTARVGDFIFNLRYSLKTSDVFGKSLQKINDFATNAAEKFKAFIARLKELKGFKITFDFLKKLNFKDLFGSIKSLKFEFKGFTRLGMLLGSAWGAISKITSALAPIFSKLGGIASTAFGKLADSITEGLGKLDFNEILSSINIGLLGGVILAIKKFISSGTGVFSGISGVIGQVSGILDSVRGSLEAMQQSLKAKTLLVIAAAIAILAVSLLTISKIDKDRLTGALAAITTLFVNLFGASGIFSKIAQSPGMDSMGKVALGLIGLSVAVLILSKAVETLGRMKPDEVMRGVLAVTTLILVMAQATNSMSANSSGMVKSAIGLLIFAVAIKVLTTSVKALADLDPDALTKGLVGVGVLIAELAVFLKVTDLGGMSASRGAGILILAGAVYLLTLAVSKLADMDREALTQGLASVGIILAQLALFLQLSGNPTQVISTAIGLTILGGAMLIFAKAIGTMGQMSWEEIGKGLLTMAVALGTIVAAMTLMPPNMAVNAVSLVIVGAALLILSNALNSMGQMSWEEIGKGLLVLGASFIILSTGLQAMSGGLVGAAALLVVSAALAILTPVLKALGKMSIAEIATALGTLAALFVILGIAGYALTPVVPTLLALSGALALFGVSVLAVGVGVFLLSVGLTALAVSAGAIAGGLVIVVGAIIGLLPAIVKGVGDVLIGLLNIIVAGGPLILQAVTVILMALVEGIVAVIPAVVAGVLLLVTSLLTELARNLPAILQAGLDIVMALLQGINDNIFQIVTTAISIVTKFIDAIASKIPDVIDSAFNLIISFVNGLAAGVEAHLEELIVAGTSLAVAIVTGLIGGIMAAGAAVKEAVTELGKAAWQSLKDALGTDKGSPEFNSLGQYTSQGFAQGLTADSSAIDTALTVLAEQTLFALETYIPMFSNTGLLGGQAFRDGLITVQPEAVLAIGVIILAVLQVIEDHKPRFYDAGIQAIETLVNGMNVSAPKITVAFRTMMEAAFAEMTNIYDRFYELGVAAAKGFIDGITSNIPPAVEAAITMANAVVEGVRANLLISSPSRVFQSIGSNIGLGLARGIYQGTNGVETAANRMAASTLVGIQTAINGISDFLSGNMELVPTIRPVLDLSDVRTGARLMQGLMGVGTLSISAPRSLASSIAAPQSEYNGTISPDASRETPVTYIQNNYSPKALSPIEVYRMTRNQLSTLRKVAGVT
jgi:tape measure domain-containing protein